MGVFSCYYIRVEKPRLMPNKHLEHPEDAVFDGKRQVLYNLKQMVSARTNISVKYDGAPAIVFGINPNNGRFFVGTKSVFNKKKVLINYTHEDIDKNHSGNVADILRLCLRYLPRTPGINQADWIGVGGGRVYTPNTITYRFPSATDCAIILAPHTSYAEVSPTAVGKCGLALPSTEDCEFINTRQARSSGIKYLDLTAKILRHLPFMKIPQGKSRDFFRKYINDYIRNGECPSAQTMCDSVPDKYKGDVNIHTFIVWHLMSQLKERLLDSITVKGNIECFINGQPTNHEGFVIISQSPLKIVDRQTFSKANFNLDKNWTNEEV